MLTEYVTAQQIGEGKIGPGECFPYYKKCPKSIFKNGKQVHKYRLVSNKNAVPLKIYRFKLTLLDLVHFSHISSEEEETELDENLIDLDDAENELNHLNKNKDATKSIFNM